jgi:hypothetical protein
MSNADLHFKKKKIKRRKTVSYSGPIANATIKQLKEQIADQNFLKPSVKSSEEAYFRGHRNLVEVKEELSCTINSSRNKSRLSKSKIDDTCGEI